MYTTPTDFSILSIMEKKCYMWLQNFLDYELELSETNFFWQVILVDANYCPTSCRICSNFNLFYLMKLKFTLTWL